MVSSPLPLSKTFSLVIHSKALINELNITASIWKLNVAYESEPRVAESDTKLYRSWQGYKCGEKILTMALKQSPLLWKMSWIINSTLQLLISILQLRLVRSSQVNELRYEERLVCCWFKLAQQFRHFMKSLLFRKKRCCPTTKCWKISDSDGTR